MIRNMDRLFFLFNFQNLINFQECLSQNVFLCTKCMVAPEANETSLKLSDVE